MKIEITLTEEQADLLLLELGALIQSFDLEKEKVDQVLDIRKEIARAMISNEGVNYG